MLRRGGAFLEIDGHIVADGQDEEYKGLYARFRTLIATGESKVEMRPLQLAADAFMIADRAP